MNGNLQSSIDAALARAFLHRFLAKAFEDPTADGWRWLTSPETLRAFRSSVETLTAEASRLGSAASLLGAQLHFEAFEPFQSAYLAAFGHAARGPCPLNEIEYGELQADALFQPHRLADLAAFYRAFGLEVADDATERQDHLALELEFMSVLAVKEAYALEHQLDGDQLALCRDAQKKFLRDHLGRWTPAFARRLTGLIGHGALGALAEFTREFIAAECGRFGVRPGSEELLLRPVEASAESLCGACGITDLPPGALRTDS